MVADPIRQTILSALADEKTISRTELAETLAADDDIPATDTDSLEISLHHNHLPKLADDHYIEYDTRTGDLAIWKDPQRIREQLHDE